jgi:hypothetical protein
MNMPLVGRVEQTLRAEIAAPVRALAATLGREAEASAVLFYGSNLRTGALDGVLDFYVLTPGPAERGIWPTVSYREVAIGGVTLRAKIATMRLATFRKAADGDTIDTTIWTRFVQPSALAWAATPTDKRAVINAVAAAAITASRYAAALGPDAGPADAFWRALFRATYAAELRVERPGREEQLLANGQQHFAALLPLAWAADGQPFEQGHGRMRPLIDAEDREEVRRSWRRRQRLGRPLNLLRLTKAAFTFDGAARYGAWKIERHTGVPVPLTPWRERHPLLAAPAVLWRVWRAARS